MPFPVSLASRTDPAVRLPALPLLLLCLVRGSASRALAVAADGAWSNPAPNSRSLHSLVYDTARGRIIVIGGTLAGGGLTNDVWAVPLGGSIVWQPLAPTGTPPSARTAFSAIYDPVRDRVLVFGGSTSSGFVADVWQLSLAGTPAWSLLTVAGTLPSARAQHTAIYDPVRDRMVVFGGLTTASYTSDTWALTLGASPQWAPLAPTGTLPVSRGSHSAVYDPLRDRMLVFGGNTTLGARGDLWELSLSGTPAWNNVVTAGTPPAPRYGQAAGYDATRDRMLIHDGTGFAPFLDDLWTLSLSGTPTWASATPLGTRPLARTGAGAVVDPVHDQWVEMGGRCSDGPLADLWILPLAPGLAFAEITPGGPAPCIRQAGGAIHDPLRGRLIVFGGRGSLVTGSDTWALSLSGPRNWTPLAAVGAPLGPRSFFGMVYDPVRDRALVLGGLVGDVRENQVWSLSLAGTPQWTQLSVTGAAPPAWWDGSAVYDLDRDRVLVFGGADASGDRNDVWALSLTGAPSWTQLAPSGIPPATREGHIAIYDPVRDRMLVFGGSHVLSQSFVDLNDTWELSLEPAPAWTQLSPTGAPPSARFGMTGEYEPGADRWVVFGGVVGTTPTNEAWALSLAGTPSWAQLTPEGSPPVPRYNSRMIRDAASGRLIVFGGKANSELMDDVWSLTPSSVLSAPPQGPSVCELRTPAPNPGRGAVTISYALANGGRVRLAVFDVHGRHIRTLLDAERPAGEWHTTWDGTTDARSRAGGGVFFLRLESAGASRVRRVVLLQAGR